MLLVSMAGIWLMISGCATPYRGPFGGCSVKEISAGIYEVSYSGNNFTSRDRARLAVMYRCAELTIEKGCDYFVEMTELEVKTTSAPQTTTVIISPGALPSNAFDAAIPAAPSARVVVKVFKGDKPADYPNAMNAREIQAEIQRAF